MLSPELERLHSLLTELKEHEHQAGLLLEDEYGCRWSIQKAYAVGSRTDDPGLVVRLVSRTSVWPMVRNDRARPPSRASSCSPLPNL